VLSVLHDPDCDLLIEAMKLLAWTGVPRDTRFIEAVTGQLKHEHLQIRLLALSILAGSAPAGNNSAAVAVCSVLDDVHEEVRQQALCALQRLVCKGDSDAIAAACIHLKHKRPEVRCSGLQALAKLATKGNSTLISSVKRLLEDLDVRVRHEALKTLAALDPEGHENLGIVASSAHRVLLAGSARLRPVHPGVQLAAANILSSSTRENYIIDSARNLASTRDAWGSRRTDRLTPSCPGRSCSMEGLFPLASSKRCRNRLPHIGSAPQLAK